MIGNPSRAHAVGRHPEIRNGKAARSVQRVQDAAGAGRAAGGGMSVREGAPGGTPSPPVPYAVRKILRSPGPW
jgi:hypothetical protein